MIEDLKFQKFKIQDQTVNGTPSQPVQGTTGADDGSIFTVNTFTSVDGNIFTNSSYEQIEKNMEAKVASSDDKDKPFWQNIKDFGLKNVFKFLDTNNNDKIDDSEMKLLAGFDQNVNDVSMTDMQGLFMMMGLVEQPNKSILENNPFQLDQINVTQKQGSMFEPQAVNYGGGNSGGGDYSGGGNVAAQQPAGETPEQKIQNLETKIIPDAEKSIQDINQKAEADIQSEEEKLQKAVDGDSNISQELKTQYDQMQTQSTELAQKISDTDNKVSQKDSELASIDGNIAGMESEKGGLNTSSDNKEANDKNQARMSELETKISELKTKKSDLQKEKDSLSQEKTKLEEEKTKLESDKQKLQAQIQQQASPETKQALQDSKQKIDEIKNKKTQDISAAQSTLTAKRAELTQLKQEQGTKAAKKLNTSDFDKAMQFVLDAEGGYSNDPNDPGGATMKGITHGEYDKYRQEKGLPAQDVRNISDEEMKDIYYNKYYAPSGAADVKDPKLALAIFDTAVNMGLGGLQNVKSRVSNAGQELTYENFMAKRQDRYDSIIANNPKLGVFRQGWKNRLTNLDNFVKSNY